MPQNTVWIFTITGKRRRPIHVAASLHYVDSIRIIELEQDMNDFFFINVPRAALEEDPLYYVRTFFERNGIQADVCFPVQYEI